MKNPIQAVSDAMLTEKITRPVEDPFQFLKEHHRKLEKLFSKVEEKTEQEEMRREGLFARIDEELILHTEIEEMLVYPKFLAIEETRALTEQANEEHQIAKDLLMELEMLPYDSREWTTKMQVLIENVRHHIEEEESELLPKAESNFSESDEEELGREIEQFLVNRKEE